MIGSLWDGYGSFVFFQDFEPLPWADDIFGFAYDDVHLLLDAVWVLLMLLPQGIIALTGGLMVMAVGPGKTQADDPLAVAVGERTVGVAHEAVRQGTAPRRSVAREGSPMRL